MQSRLSFGYKDLFRVVYISLEPKKLLSQALVLTASAGILLAFLALSGLFQDYLKLFPACLQALGWIAAYLVLLAGGGPTAVLTLGDLNTGRPPALGKAWKTGLQYAPALAFSSLGLISFILAVAAGLLVLNWMGRIPALGPLLWALGVFPQFLLSLFLVCGLITLVAGTLLLPAIVVDAPHARRQAFSRLAKLIKKDFFRFWGYFSTALFLGAISFALVTLLFTAAGKVAVRFSSRVAGDQAGWVLLSIPEVFQNLPSGWQAAFPLPATPLSGGWAYSAGGAAAGAALLIIHVLWLSYPILYLFTSGAVIYFALSERG